MKTLSKIFTIMAVVVFFTACEKDESLPEPVASQKAQATSTESVLDSESASRTASQTASIDLHGYWKLYTKYVDQGVLVPSDGAILIEQYGNTVQMYQEDQLVGEGVIENDNLYINTDLTDIKTDKLTIQSTHVMKAASHGNPKVEYYQLIKIDLSGRWQVTDNWWTGELIDMGVWTIVQEEYEIRISRDGELITEGELWYDEVFVEGILRYGITTLNVISKDLLESDLPTLESSNGLTFERVR